MITIAIYNPTYKNNWNEFVKNSKNATFMFQRDYMEYHSERFQDLSLMFYNDEKLVAIMPCSFNDNQIVSHAGLSFGGILSTYKMTVSIMLECFEALTTFMKNKSIKSLIYKCIPNIYHLYPSQEDLYALFINHAKLIRRDIASVIYLPEKIKFSKGKKWGISKAKQFGVEVKQFYDFAMFINYENVILHQKYGTTAVHSADEISYLAQKFPENIKMFGGFINSEFLGGAIIYETPIVAHTQYITTTEKGKEVMALELVMDYLVNNYYAEKKYFSFGISTEHQGRYLNTGLISQKEMFGGRGITHDFYEIVF